MKKIFFITLGILSAVSLFQSCQQRDKTKDAATETVITQTGRDYMQEGNAITQKTFDTLKATLIKMMNEKGPAEATEYCNVNAYAITDVYASQGITVERTSLRYRNPKNAPDSFETFILSAYRDAKEKGDSLKPRIERSPDGTTHFFKPILLQSMCQTCHGDPTKDIPVEVFKKIQALYSTDLALNFKEGDLRGMWHITFKP
jgi:Protein of unknown function (DUF3365)